MTTRTAIGWAIGGLIIGLYQSTIATFLPHPYADIDMALLVIVYLLFRQRLQEPYVVAIFSGVVMDVFAPDVAEVAWLKYLLIATLLYLISKRLLTNFSIYSVVALGVCAQLVSWLWQAALSVVFSQLSLHLRDTGTWSQFGRTLFATIICLSAMFYLDAFITRRFMPYRRVSV